MPAEQWTLLAKIRGEFVISDQAVSSATRPDQRLRRLELTPEFDEENKYTGLHELTVQVDLENTQPEPLPSYAALEQGKDIADSIVAAISLATGRPVTLESISLRYDLPEPGKHRMVIGTSETASLAPPSLLDPSLLVAEVDRKARRVIRWWARGIAASDGVERLGALTNALDLLAGDYDVASERTRKCSACGHTENLGPGLRERVVAYLTEQLGYDQQTADAVYESRIDLAHGRSLLSEEDLPRFRIQAESLATAIRTGLGQRLGIELPTTPELLPFDLPSAVLDVCYEDPPSNEGPV